MGSTGKVYLVGAGPGDAGLLTMRGAELLRRADVVVYDALVNRELLALAPEAAEVIFGGKRPRDRAIPQDELNRLLAEKSGAGKTVVRLKGGDPYIFGRGGEEAAGLRRDGVPFEVVPGISSIIAAPSYAGIPLTHREHCSSFTVITGHEDPDKKESALDWERIAREPGTKVLLMGVERIGKITAALEANGLPADTPAAMIRWGTMGRQQTITGTLATLADKVAKADFKAPAVTVIGGVSTLRDTLNWFENRPLFGQRVVVTRTRREAGKLSGQLRDLGAEVLEIPTIRIVPPTSNEPIIEAVTGIGSYDWIIFTSANGVEHFFDYFFKAYRDVRDLGNIHFAAVGPGTAKKLRELHLHIDLMPEVHTAEATAKALLDYQNVENTSMLLARAEEANPELPRLLEDKGAIVDDIAFYKTVPETADRNGAAEEFEAHGADWITFASGSAVRSFDARFGLAKRCEDHPGLKLASIGPETTKAIKALGLQPAVEAKDHTIDGLANALLKQ
ncbi:MAG: uroporphyrinogen-III C-methyltransferase [Verrucomicrobiota bacterium]|jgi:uroporphyrinogen III methyltransferase/synthase|nr:uroporphyrinogen-III C-methyltransferase [Verrucomicrobiota bacterium]MDP6251176.1 uroporphyrinogen-III C-methyltransferase [Verrucomicrobiota bacterium]MDP7177473.1 uroporphyrinogen-III C-methyltransferase [Verrucomicrobiota bacterium]MDP7291336.1 uroporphyrinogen-III C-methyltransferase [Verrucomicrobiota bacterium]MDP7441090.1 uroporphyrinogen-III C-methyltransferase [Verrucomicrobiota bacterium]